MRDLLISGPRIFSEKGVFSHGSVLTKRDKIIKVFSSSEKRASPDTQIIKFPSSYNLIPGMIDLHTHGAGGSDVMDGAMDAFTAIAEILPKEGVTSFLPATMTKEIKAIEGAVEIINRFAGRQKDILGAEVLGIHLEGPFISRHKAGAQCAKNILPPSISLLKKIQKLSGGLIKIVTLAPEENGAIQLAKALKKRGIIVSIGHSNASYAEVVKAISAGCGYATHLFNAMSGINHREPGAVTALLVNSSVTVELVADGIHLHPAVIEMVYKTKGAERIVLVTDSMRAKYLRDGKYELGGQKVNVKRGRVTLGDGTLAGSVLKMNDALKNVISFTRCSLRDALKMVCENPAKLLNIYSRKGSVAEGKDADLVVLDEKYDVAMTICRGRVAYAKRFR